MELYKLGVVAVVVVSTAIYWPSSKGESSIPAQKIAKALHPILPKDMGGGMYLESVSADQDLLVLKLDVPMNAHLSSSEVSKVAAAGFCDQDRTQQFFRDGGKLRIDVSVGGGTATEGPVVDSCPT